MNDIKNAIGILCKHLNTLLIRTSLKPEQFRLAKFNKTEDNVVTVFWQVLNILTANSCINIVENVKNYFQKLNYPSPKFYLLPEDMSEGSRELLIALSYIICQKLNSLIINEFEKSSFYPEFNILHSFHNLDRGSCFRELNKFQNDLDFDNYIQWVNGKIVLNEKMTEEYSMQNQKLLEKLKSEYVIEGLSVSEILALNSQKYSRVFLEKSERIMQILENHSNWMKKEQIFWKWMDTVLLERDKELMKLNI